MVKKQSLSTPKPKTQKRSGKLFYKVTPKRFVTLASIVIFAFIAAGLIFQAFAAPPSKQVSLILSPASAKLSVGDTLMVGIWVNAVSQQVNAAQVNLTYSVDLFDFVSIDTSTSAFATEAQSAGGGGTIQLARGSISPLTGNQLFAIVSLRAKAPTRSAQLTFSTGSAVVSADTNQNILVKTVNGKYTIH